MSVDSNIGEKEDLESNRVSVFVSVRLCMGSCVLCVCVCTRMRACVHTWVCTCAFVWGMCSCV